MQPNHDENSPLPDATRAQVARDMLVFQAKLFTDGLKDIILSPMSLIAGLVGIFLGRGNPGMPLYELLRFGQRVENWIDLFSAAYTKPDASQTALQPGSETETGDTAAANTKDFDALLERVQSVILDPKQRARLSDQSKSQLDAIAKKLRGE